MIQTACPLDCYDACKVLVDPKNPKKLFGAPHPYTKERLCVHLYRHFPNAKRITKPKVNGKEVSLDEALDAVADALKKKWLLWRGSGNLALMQEVTNLLAKRANGVITRGSLCDGAGDAGIVEGRGVNKLLSPHQIAKADVVVIWGRNVTETSPHLVDFIKDKKIVVIDPRKIPITKNAILHLQIKPRSDFYLAILLARFLIMEGAEDSPWLEKFASEWEDYYEFTRTFRIKAILEHIGISLDDLGDLLLLLQEKRVVFLVGAGVQRNCIGNMTLRAIDAVAAILGLFGKEGCGVSYLSNSKLGLENPFEITAKSEPKAATPFAKYESVLIQGGNPAHSMPNSNKVVKELKEVENIIYFGLYENETSALSNIIIPAKSFLEKDDVRLSYGHEYMLKMNKVYESDIGISEYDFTQEILKRLNLEPIESESFYIEHFLKQAKRVDDHLISPAFEEIPYKDGFSEDGEDEFEFIDDFYDDFENIKALRRFRRKVKKETQKFFYLLTPKSKRSLNSQFAPSEVKVYLSKEAGFKEGDEVVVISDNGALKAIVAIDDELRSDVAVIYSYTKGVNKLTPSHLSDEGENACYGDVKVIIEPL